MKRAVAIASVLGVAFAMACGNNFSDDIALPPDASFVDFTVPTEASPFDVFVKPDTGPPYNGGGPFDCFGCVCDGTQNICIAGGGGGAPPKAPVLDAGDDADADEAGDASVDVDAADAEPACPPDAGLSACFPIPLSCLPKPTCDCIEQVLHTGCACSVIPDGNGFVFTCPPRP